MKSFGLFCFCLVWNLVAHAELDTVWTRQLELNQAGYTIDGAVLLQNGETMLSSAHSNEGIVDLWRLSQLGDVVWEGSISIPSQYFGVLGLVQMNEGHVIICCAYQGQTDPTATLYLKAISTTGADVWERYYQFTGLDWQPGFKKLSDNTFVAYISTYGDQEPTQARLAKFDSDGDTLWTRNVGPNGLDEQARDVSELPNGDLVLTGQYTEENFYIAGYVMRVTSSGTPVWTRTYTDDTQFGMSCTCVDVNSEGDIIVGGYIGNFWWFNRPWAISLSEDGDENWLLSDLPDEDCAIYGVRAQSDGGAIMVGSTQPNFGLNQAKVLSAGLDGSGRVELQFEGDISYFAGMNTAGTRGAVAYGAISDETFVSHGLALRFGPGTILNGFVREQNSNQPVEGARIELIETGEYAVSDVQGIYLLGISQPTGTIRVTNPCTEPIEQTVTLIEGEENILNFSAGVPIYQNSVSSLNMVATFGIAETETFEVNNFGDGDLHFTTSAHEQTPTYGWLSVTPASGVIPPGQTAAITVTVQANAEHPEAEFFGEVHVHHNSCPDTVNEIGVFTLALDSPNQSSLVETFAMHAAYPNPFNNTARVAFDLPQTAQVSAKLYSIDGREAATLTKAQYTAGRHELAISGDALATGVYLLRLTTGTEVATQKVILLK